MDKIAQTSATGSIIAELWNEVLRRDDQVQGDDNFFRQGGDAIAAARLEQRIEDEIPVALEPGTVREAPTLSQLTSSVQLQIEICRLAYVRMMAEAPPKEFRELFEQGLPGAPGIVGDPEFIARVMSDAAAPSTNPPGRRNGPRLLAGHGRRRLPTNGRAAKRASKKLST